MTTTMRWTTLAGALLLALTVSAASGQQTTEKVFIGLSTEQLETILNEMSIKFTKTKPPKFAEDWDYDFERNTYRMRLTLGNGKLVWLSAYFPKCSLEKINEWNVSAKFSRAILERVDNKEYATVESQIDAAGGVTLNMLRQFLRRFDNECSAFDQFLRK